MTGNIEQIENKAKREKLRSQLRKTKDEIEILIKEVAREERLNSIEDGGPEPGFRAGLIVKQKVDFQSYEDTQEVEEQNAAVLKIQKDTEQLAEAYKSLRGLVYDQKPNIIVIEKNAVKTNQNIKEAVKELDKTVNVHKARRKKVCVIISFVLILVGLV